MAEVIMIPQEATSDPTATATLTLAASSGNATVEGKKIGLITVTPAATITVDGVKTYTIKLATGQTLTVKNKAKGAVSAATFTLSIE